MTKLSYLPLVCQLIVIFSACIIADFPVENDNDGEMVLSRNKTQEVKLQRRVINGVEADPDDWKFLVALMRKNNYGNLVSRKILTYNSKFSPSKNKRGKQPNFPIPVQQRFYYSCGGSLISPNFVLTAGHCVVDDNNKLLSPSSMAIRIGAHRLSANDDTNIDDVEVAQIFLRDGFDVKNLAKGNDVALLKLKRPVNFTPAIQNAPLPSSGLNLPTGTVCLAAGWGQTEKGTASDLPLEVDVPVFDFNACSWIWRLSSSAKDGRLICAIAPDFTEDTCFGDSGGPLICKLPTSKNKTGKWILAGAVSFGSQKCADQGVPAIYTSISYHLPWIMKIVNGTQPKSW